MLKKREPCGLRDLRRLSEISGRCTSEDSVILFITHLMNEWERVKDLDNSQSLKNFAPSCRMVAQQVPVLRYEVNHEGTKLKVSLSVL